MMYDDDDLLPLDTRSPEDNPMLHTSQGVRSTLDCDLFGFLESLLFTFTFFMLCSTFVASFTQVSGASMDPSLNDGELLLLWSWNYTPEIGDVVIINKPTSSSLNGVSIVKRVIAKEGQTVQINYNTDEVLVDGVAIYEPYIMQESLRPIYGHEISEEIRVPEGSIYVLGDNRNHSADSRAADIGTIDEGYVLGKAVLGLFPISSWRVIS